MMTETSFQVVLVTPRFSEPLENLERQMYSRAEPMEKTESDGEI